MLGNQNLLEQIRESDLLELTNAAGDLPHHSHELHAFVAPSGRLCDEFFRCANVLVSAVAIEAIAFWLFPFVKDVDVVLIDTWSISPVAYRLRQSLTAKGAQEPDQARAIGRIFDVHGFVAHPYADPEQARKTVRKALERVQPGRRILILASVASTGRFEEVVMQILWEERMQPFGSEVGYLFSLSDASEDLSGKALLSLDRPACLADDALLERRDRVIIDPVLFYQRPSTEKAVEVKFKHFGLQFSAWVPLFGRLIPELPGRTYRSLLTEYSNQSSVLGLHREYLGKHYAYFIDVGQLCSSKGFMTRTAEKVSAAEAGGGEWDAVCHSRSNASRDFAMLLSTITQSPVCTMDELSSVARPGSKILFAKEAVASGSSLIGDSIGIRESVAAAGPSRIDYCIAVSRGSDDGMVANTKALSVGNGWASEIIVIDRMPLPNDDFCPWCQEEQVLQRRSKVFGYREPPAWLTNRIQVFGEENSGRSPFLEGVRIPHVGHSSPVFPKGWQPVAACFYIAVALENMRRDPKA